MNLEMDVSKYFLARHRAVELPCVRILAGRAGGSGTVIYSAPNGNGNGDGSQEIWSTFVLTNHHVIARAITLEDKWDPVTKTERKMDSFAAVEVHFFKYRYASRSHGGESILADIVAYDEDHDLALLGVRMDDAAPAVAKLYPRGEENWLRPGMPVVTVGAGLGEPPVQTLGALSQFGREIDRKEYWLTTAPTYFGNSGGAVFLGDLSTIFPQDDAAKDRTWTMIGVPARIAVSVLGFSADAVTHLSFAVPVSRIYNFLDAQKYRFIYDPIHTEKSEAEERQRLRDEADRKLAAQ